MSPSKLTLCLAVLLAAPAGATSLLLVPRTEAARTTCEELVEVFTAQKVTVKMAGAKSSAVGCLKEPTAARPACFLTAAKASKVDGVVLISATKKAGKLVVTMELLSQVTGKVRTTQKVKAPPKALRTKATVPVQRLVVELLTEDSPLGAGAGAPLATAEEIDDDELAPLPSNAPPPKTQMPVAQVTPPPVVSDAPKAVALTPAVVDTPVVVAPAPQRGSAVPAAVVTGVAVAAAAAAAVFGGLALSGQSQLQSASGGTSTLSYQEAVALQQQTNTQFTVALGAGIGAGVCAGVAAALWGTR